LVSHLKMGVSFLVCLIIHLEIVNVVCVNLNKNRVILLFEFGLWKMKKVT
jgi:hypothetical protein